MSEKISRSIVTLAIGACIYLIAIGLPLLTSVTVGNRLVLTLAIEFVLSMGVIALLGWGNFAAYGFRRAEPGTWPGAMVSGGFAAGLGVVSTLAIVLLRGGGHPLLGQLKFLQIVILVWIGASTVEEIFTRGFLQSQLAPLNEHLILRLPVPVLISALFFSSMHLILFFRGADLVTVACILVFTFLLGFLAGHQRARTGSLLPAIVIHCLANVGGIVGGIIAVLIRYLQTGQLPHP